MMFSKFSVIVLLAVVAMTSATTYDYDSSSGGKGSSGKGGSSMGSGKGGKGGSGSGKGGSSSGKGGSSSGKGSSSGMGSSGGDGGYSDCGSFHCPPGTHVGDHVSCLDSIDDCFCDDTNDSAARGCGGHY